MTEAALIARIRAMFPPRRARVGIGDDAAVVGDQVFTTDMLIEDVDFTLAIPLHFIARKSLAVNLSDLAAMGATPELALVSLAMPRTLADNIDPFLRALAAIAAEYDVEIIGGDLSRSEKLVISVTMIGRASERVLLRSGGRPGDRVYLSRPIGGSAAGLSLLQRGWSIGEDGTVLPPRDVRYVARELAASAIRRHVDPEPEVQLGRELTRLTEVTAAIDVSDGLSTDLHHLCIASGCGAEIERERIPVLPDLPESGAALGVNVRDAVLHGGEEYALLFTSTGRESELSAILGRPVYAIGRLTEGREVVLKGDGPLEPTGFDHFG
jgi:thiamine-monophosphate kinase